MNRAKNQKKRHAHFGDLLSAVLWTWTPLRLANLMGALRVTLSALSVQKQECTIEYAQTARIVLPVKDGTEALTPLAALDYLETELRAIVVRQDEDALALSRGSKTRVPLSASWVRTMSETARAVFLVLFFKDGRVRRLVMTPHRIHNETWQTTPPDEKRFRNFLKQGADDLVLDYIRRTQTPAEPLAPPLLAEATWVFVRSMARWWTTSSRSTIWSPPLPPPPTR